ncbi:SAV_2336 N-terminal domain-related protein [Streptomyces sp. cmx-4-9]|uniref:SAV_2336 N-terminal domain-related protein n=1 Tax=Streptomyces sp. cmx-4-9 TaxID=2790941 RepID=UPI003980E7CC
MPIRELAALLRAAGLDPTAEELCDALWLAAKIRPPGTPVPGAPAAGRPAAAPGKPEPQPDPDPGSDPGPDPAAAPDADTGDPVSLHAAGARRSPAPPGPALPPEPGVPVRVPRAAALPRILDIQRALRALQQHRPAGPPTRKVLDEGATAEASARALGLIVPVLRPDTRREATARLVMDASPSMAVWQDVFDELRAVCERLGAFRDVQVHYLHRLPDGTPALGRGPLPATALRSGDQLRDPTGRELTMVVSDCTGPLWREGRAQRLLYRWAECTPCVVVQPLPQRLWGRSWLPTERGAVTRVEGGAGRLRFRPDRPPRPGRPAGGLPVPVLPPGAIALGAWARLVAGLGTGPVPAEVARVLAAHPAAPAPPPAAARPPRELVRRFRSSASPRAVQLALYLAAAPLTLPVMRLVQRTMLPDSEPSDLAEVLLSGLLRRSGPGPGQWYAFVPGVQDVLLGPLGRDEAALVLKHCSEYVLAHFGRGVRNFPALAVSQLTGAPVPGGAEGPPDDGRPPAEPLPQAFAQVSAKVVRRYLPGLPESGPGAEPPPPPAAPAPGRSAAVRTARDRLADADAGGGVDARALHEAVAVLRRALAAPAGPGDPPEEAEAELALALLRLWAAERDPALLAEAEQTVAALATAAARLAHGRVLYERALAAEPDAELLAAADREFAAAGALPGLDAPLRRDCAVRRARTLIRLSELRDEPGALREARAALEPLAGPPPDPPPVPGPHAGPPAAAPAPAPVGHPELHLALGRVLLALLPVTPDPADRADLAARAAARLAVDPAAAPAERARVRVERAEALRHLPDRLEEAAAQLAAALEEAAGEPGLRIDALVGAARVHRARYGRDADPAALEDAAEAYGRARRLVPRDSEAYGELLPEWGEVLLERARAAGGRPFTGAAVRVLRESRAAVPQSDPRAAHRLLRLAAGLRLRHVHEGDLVDLREAEYLLELAVRQSRSPLDQALAWRDHGDLQQEVHGHTGAADRLDRAADSYRRAWLAALVADREEGPEAADRPWHEGRPHPEDRREREDREDRRGAAVRLAARVQEARGEVLERLARPRAALDAYRSALELWTRLGTDAAGEAAATAEADADADPGAGRRPDPGAAGADTGTREGARGRAAALRARIRILEAGP